MSSINLDHYLMGRKEINKSGHKGNGPSELKVWVWACACVHIYFPQKFLKSYFLIETYSILLPYK